MRIVSLALMIGLLAPGAPSAASEQRAGQGVYTDSTGQAHPWHITPNNALIWDGQPYIPIGVFYGVAPAKKRHDNDRLPGLHRNILTRIREHGVEDLELLSGPFGEDLQPAIDLFEELKLRYVISLAGGEPTGRALGYAVNPEPVELPRDKDASLIVDFLTREHVGRAFMGETLFVVVARESGEFVRSGHTQVGNDGSVEIELPRGRQEDMLIFFSDKRKVSADFWGGGTEDYIRTLTRNMAQVRMGPGLRGYADPIGGEYRPPKGVVIAAPKFRTEFRDWLRERYPSLEQLAEAWGIGPTDLGSYERAAGLVPVAKGPKDSTWRNVGYAVDQLSGQVLRVDLGHSSMWWDVCEFREISIRQRMNKVCRAIKQVHDVPIITKRFEQTSRVYVNPGAPGLDGLGMDTYGTGEGLIRFCAATSYGEVAQWKRPCWFVVGETSPAGSATEAGWRQTYIGYSGRQQMFRDYTELLRIGAKGIYAFMVNPLHRQGDHQWTIHNLDLDPRQLGWIGEFARAVRGQPELVDYRPQHLLYFFAPQKSDAKRFGPADMPDFGLSGHWRVTTGLDPPEDDGAVLHLAQHIWAVPVYSPDVSGPVAYSEMVRDHPFLRGPSAQLEAAEAGGKRDLWKVTAPSRDAIPAALIDMLKARVVDSVQLEARDIDDKLIVTAFAENGEWTVLLRATAWDVGVQLSSRNGKPMSVKLPGHADFATVASESTFQLAAGTLKERGFHLDNPSFGVKNHEFRCVAGEEGEVLEIRGVPPDELSISITESVRPYRPLYGERKDDQMVTAAPLDGNVQPEYGTLLEAKGWKPAAGPEGQPNTAIELDGAGGMIKYKIVGFPNEQFTVSIWVSVTAFPKQGRIGQVFSAWWAGNDDPLRLVVDSSKLAARIEAGKEYSTEGVALEIGRWYHVAGVKQDNQLTLYIDGRVRLTTAAPRALSSGAECFALGGNPCSATSPELLAARMAGLKFYARALGIEEVKKLSEAGQVKGK